MSAAAIGMLVVSILGGLVALGIGLYAASAQDRWYAIVSGFAVLLTAMICGVCWRFLPNEHDYHKKGYIRQQYRERVWSEYKKCFDKCQEECHRQAEKTLDYFKERTPEK